MTGTVSRVTGRSRPRVISAIAAGLAGALIAAACTGRSETGPESRAGGTLRIGSIYFADFHQPIRTPEGAIDFTLDPASGLNVLSGEFFRCCLLRTLMSYSGRPTEEGGADLRPDLAAGPPEVSADGLTWTFRMKTGIHYGPPLESVEITAPDFIRAVERDLRPTPKALAGFLGPSLSSAGAAFWQDVIEGARAFAAGDASTISGLEAPDEHTLRVHVTRVNGDVGYLFSQADSAPIPPDPTEPTERLGAAQGHDAAYGRFLVASGPYMFAGSEDLDFSAPPDKQDPVAGYVPNESITLVRNPSWDRSTDSLRPAYPDRIELTMLPTEDEVIRRVERGGLDLSYDVPLGAELVRLYQSDPKLAGRLISHPNDVVFLISMNLATPPLDDVHVRKAVNLAADKARFQALAVAGNVVVAGSLGGDIAGHLVPDGLEDNLLLGYDPYETPGHAGSVDAARAEIAMSARYDHDSDGVCDAAACSDVLVLVRNDEPFWGKVAGRLRRDLMPLGITLRLRKVPLATIFGTIFDPTARIPMGIGFRFIKDFPTPSSLFHNFFPRSSLGTGMNWSLTGARPAELERWGYRVRNVVSLDERIGACRERLQEQIQCWADLDQYVMEQVVPTVPFLFGTSEWIVSERVTAFSFDQFYDYPALDRFELGSG